MLPGREGRHDASGDRLERARALIEVGRYVEAMGEAERAAALAPEAAEPHVLRAIALHELDRFIDAQAAAENALRLDPELGRAHLMLSYALLRQGIDAPRMVEAADIAARTDDDPLSWHQVVRARLAIDDLGGAERAVALMRQQNPEALETQVASAHVLLARPSPFVPVFALWERVPLVLRVVILVLVNACFAFLVLLVLGHKAVEVIRIRQALRHMDQALRLEPENARVLALKAELEGFSRRYGRAVDFSIRAANLDPSAGDAAGVVRFTNWRIGATAVVALGAWGLVFGLTASYGVGHRHLSPGTAAAIPIGVCLVGVAVATARGRAILRPLPSPLRQRVHARGLPFAVSCTALFTVLVSGVGLAADAELDPPVQTYAEWAGSISAAVLVPATLAAGSAWFRARRAHA